MKGLRCRCVEVPELEKVFGIDVEYFKKYFKKRFFSNVFYAKILVDSWANNDICLKDKFFPIKVEKGKLLCYFKKEYRKSSYWYSFDVFVRGKDGPRDINSIFKRHEELLEKKQKEEVGAKQEIEEARASIKRDNKEAALILKGKKELEGRLSFSNNEGGELSLVKNKVVSGE